MNKLKAATLSIILSLTMGCAANKVDPGAESVNLVTIYPNDNLCTAIGDVIGSQGNWIAGNFTPNMNLIAGARNSLRNEAYKLGANLVYIEAMENTDGWSSLGINNTTIVGKAFDCGK